MLKELFELVRGTAQESVINNPAVPNERNDEVIAEATNTVASGLRNIVAGGGVQNLLALLGNKSQAGNLMRNPIVNMMIGHFAGKLINKYGFGGAQANSVANGLIPEVLGNLVNKTNDPGDNTFSLENLLNSITGGKSAEVLQHRGGGNGFNLPGLLNEESVESQGGSGGLMDIITKMAEGAQAQQQRNGGGGLMDLIKGFMR